MSNFDSDNMDHLTVSMIHGMETSDGAEEISVSERDLLSELFHIISSPQAFKEILIELEKPMAVHTPGGWRALAEKSFLPVRREDLTPLLNAIDGDWEEKFDKAAISHSITLTDHRVRVTAAQSLGGKGITVSIRRNPLFPTPLKDSGLPAHTQALFDAPRGLVLVSGPTGSGKTNTLASAADYLNNTRQVHIACIEDPIEFIHERKKAIFTPREVGRDVDSFRQGVKDAMRLSPDVIIIGEIRDMETAEIAMLAADSGLLVLASVHANDAPSTVTKMLSFFPDAEKGQRSQMLANTLVGVIHQAILPRQDGKGYALASELLFNDKRQVTDMIAENGKEKALRDHVAARKEGSQPLIDQLAALVKQNIVAEDRAMTIVPPYQRAEFHKLRT